MSASITLAGEQQIALKQSQQKPLIVSRFLFAHVPGLDHQTPVDRAAGAPDAAHIVYVYTIPKENAGFVNPNQVVYSAQLGSDIGDWDFNWVGLEDDDGVLFAVSYVPLQQKRKNIPPLQIGNNLTRNFLVAYDGAQALTGTTIDASTWQHDFTVRLAGIDERERLSNRNLYGRAFFFSHSLTFEKVDSGYQITGGTAYVEGIRVALGKSEPVTGAIPLGKAWLDVCLERQLNDRIAAWKVVFGEQADYTDAAGVRHYCVPLAEVTAEGLVDLRDAEPVGGALMKYLAARNGDYPHLRARGTTKDDVELGNVPNAISDDPTTNSSAIIASTKALNNLQQQVEDSMVGMVAAFDMPTAPPGWLKRNGAAVSRTAYAKLFAVIGTRYGDGDGSTTFNIGDSRGLFTRALDDGRGLDTGRALGTVQLSQNLAHAHTAATTAAGHHGHEAYIHPDGSHAHGGHTDVAGSHSHSFNSNNTPTSKDQPGIGAAMHYAATGRVAGDRINAAGEHNHNLIIYGAGVHGHPITLAANGSHVHAVTVDAAGGSEARPINEALLVCIKY